jgi:outer membrane protein
MKRIGLVLCALALAAAGAAAQTQDVTKVALCDFFKALQTSFKDTKAFRDYDQAQGDVAKEITRLTNEITDLQNQKLDADKSKDAAKSLSLQKTIDDKTTYLSTYRTVKTQWLTQQRNNLMTGPALAEVYDAVKSVAQAEGYSIVLRSDTDAMRSMLIYYLPEIDITAEVIQKIQENNKPAS